MLGGTGPESTGPSAARGGGGAGLRPEGASAGQGRESLYDSIARLYDPWSVSVTEDVQFYVDEALRVDSPVVELGIGTGRIAIPTAAAGARVIGVDSSPAMLEVCQERAELAGVADRLDLRLGELEAPPVEERVALVTCPFRSVSYTHLTLPTICSV